MIPALLLLTCLSVDPTSAEQKQSREELEQAIKRSQAALAAYDQQAGDSVSGASEAEHCEELLHSLLDGMRKLTAQGTKNSAGMLEHFQAVHDEVQQQVADTRKQVADTRQQVIDSQVQQTAVVASEVQQVREVQAVAVDQAKQAADNSQRNLLTQIFGFLTLILTIVLREMSNARTRRENATKLDKLTQIVHSAAPHSEVPHESESNT